MENKKTHFSFKTGKEEPCVATKCPYGSDVPHFHGENAEDRVDELNQKINNLKNGGLQDESTGVIYNALKYNLKKLNDFKITYSRPSFNRIKATVHISNKDLMPKKDYIIFYDDLNNFKKMKQKQFSYEDNDGKIKTINKFDLYNKPDLRSRVLSQNYEYAGLDRIKPEARKTIYEIGLILNKNNTFDSDPMDDYFNDKYYSDVEFKFHEDKIDFSKTNHDELIKLNNKIISSYDLAQINENPLLFSQIPQKDGSYALTFRDENGYLDSTPTIIKIPENDNLNYYRKNINTDEIMDKKEIENIREEKIKKHMSLDKYNSLYKRDKDKIIIDNIVESELDSEYPVI